MNKKKRFYAYIAQRNPRKQLCCGLGWSDISYHNLSWRTARMCEGGRNVWRVASFIVMLILPDIDRSIDIALHVSMIPSHYFFESVFNNEFRAEVFACNFRFCYLKRPQHFAIISIVLHIHDDPTIVVFIWNYFDAWKIIFLSITSQLNFNHMNAWLESVNNVESMRFMRTLHLEQINWIW